MKFSFCLSRVARLPLPSVSFLSLRQKYRRRPDLKGTWFWFSFTGFTARSHDSAAMRPVGRTSQAESVLEQRSEERDKKKLGSRYFLPGTYLLFSRSHFLRTPSPFNSTMGWCLSFWHKGFGEQIRSAHNHIDSKFSVQPRVSILGQPIYSAACPLRSQHWPWVVQYFTHVISIHGALTWCQTKPQTLAAKQRKYKLISCCAHPQFLRTWGNHLSITHPDKITFLLSLLFWEDLGGGWCLGDGASSWSSCWTWNFVYSPGWWRTQGPPALASQGTLWIQMSILSLLLLYFLLILTSPH